MISKTKPRSSDVIKLLRPSGTLRVINSNFDRKKGEKNNVTKGKTKSCSKSTLPENYMVRVNVTRSNIQFEFEILAQPGYFLTTIFTKLEESL